MSSPVPVASSVAGAEAGAAPASSAATDAGAAATEGPLEGTDFKTEVQAAFRITACAGDDAWLPQGVDRALVDQHCEKQKALFAAYKKDWIDVAMPFIANLRPDGLPKTVVYPFGGGDLMGAIATYPDATEVTTISLEIAGDVRGVNKPDKQKLGEQLRILRDHLSKYFDKAHSRTVNLELEQFHAIPAEVAFTMAALALHNFEPVGLRYFTFNKDGTLKYLANDELTKRQTDRSRQGPFANAEIRFKRKDEPVRVLRHVAYDLSDGNTRGSPLLKHLESKGKVSTMTKAASHLLWDDGNFAVIREYLMTHTDWMISDTTGVPPRIAKKYGFLQDVYGAYVWAEPFGTVNNNDIQAFVELFKNAKPISFRYGYPDNKSHGHIVVTRKP